MQTWSALRLANYCRNRERRYANGSRAAIRGYLFGRPHDSSVIEMDERRNVYTTPYLATYIKTPSGQWYRCTACGSLFPSHERRTCTIKRHQERECVYS